jgi:heme-degrading monooxygenase HmoA
MEKCHHRGMSQFSTVSLTTARHILVTTNWHSGTDFAQYFKATLLQQQQQHLGQTFPLVL